MRQMFLENQEPTPIRKVLFTHEEHLEIMSKLGLVVDDHKLTDEQIFDSFIAESISLCDLAEVVLHDIVIASRGIAVSKRWSIIHETRDRLRHVRKKLIG